MTRWWWRRSRRVSRVTIWRRGDYPEPAVNIELFGAAGMVHVPASCKYVVLTTQADGTRQWAGAPAEVIGALGLPERGGWEGGARDADGDLWVHEPWAGWRPDEARVAP
jgi:hypothetical protein